MTSTLAPIRRVAFPVFVEEHVQLREQPVNAPVRPDDSILLPGTDLRDRHLDLAVHALAVFRMHQFAPFVMREPFAGRVQAISRNCPSDACRLTGLEVQIEDAYTGCLLREFQPFVAFPQRLLRALLRGECQPS